MSQFTLILPFYEDASVTSLNVHLCEMEILAVTISHMLLVRINISKLYYLVQMGTWKVTN